MHAYAVLALGVLNWNDFHKLKHDNTHEQLDAIAL